MPPSLQQNSQSILGIGRVNNGAEFTCKMPGNPGLNDRQDSLAPHLAAQLDELMMFLQLPEGGVKTAFPDALACRDRLIETRWPEGVICPACGDRSVNTLPKRDLFQCRQCRKQFSPTSGTDLHRTRLSVQMWLFAVEVVIEWQILPYRLGKTKLGTLGSRLGIHTEAAVRVMRIVTRDIQHGGTGLLRRAVCMRDAGLPPTIRPGSIEQLKWAKAEVHHRTGAR